MPLTDSYVIAGLAGAPLAKGAGLKPALVLDESEQRYFNASRPDIRYDDSEVAAFERQGLLLRRRLRGVFVTDGVVLYAAKTFVYPEEQDRVVLDRSALTLHVLGGGTLYFLAYMPRDHALSVLDAWSRQLLEGAEWALRRRDREGARRALDAAHRARFCTPTAYAPGRRVSMFEHMVSASIRLGRPVEPILDDARIDFDDARVANIRRAGVRRSILVPPARLPRRLYEFSDRPIARGSKALPRVRLEGF